MLYAKSDKYQTGHEPAVQCLATFCNTKEYVVVIGKSKKVPVTSRIHASRTLNTDPASDRFFTD